MHASREDDVRHRPGGLNGAPPLGEAFTSPDTRQRYVRRLFSTIADRYDLITVLLSFGLDRRWKRHAIAMATEHDGRRALDLACGTGDIAFGLSARGVSVVGLDVTYRMLELAQDRAAAHSARRTAHRARRTAHRAARPAFIQGDMMALPFADGQFDIVTTGYGLRNVPALEPAIREIERVLRPGGVLVSLDFNRPSNALVRGVYLTYLFVVGSALGWTLHRDPDTYRYIPASIRRYPGAAAVRDMMGRSGFAIAKWIPVLGGLMAIHVARKAQ